ncbi:MAG TPA: hypothetical protein VNN10_01395 [Dehalococcoidia bacterium]|nr:hypothetical protein [Dehalococcoidia bacterium]
MEYGIAIVAVFLLLIAYVILQETRAQMHWRKLVAEGNVDAVRQLLEDEVERWHTERVPKGVPALLWHGIQTVELIDVRPDAARLNCSAEAEYQLVQGRRVETSSPLAEAKKITMKLADMVLYEVPNVKLARVQIDVYTSFRDEVGHSEPRCILSTIVERKDVEDLDWEGITPEEFVARTRGRFAVSGNGAVHPVEPLPWEGGATAADTSPGKQEG